MSFLDKKEIPCTAPCSMYSVLLENGYIPDPFYGTNELELRHLSRHDCDFSCEFEVDEKEYKKQYHTLTFHGLDTICDIVLNGSPLASVMNMHRSYTYDVASLLRVGKNTLKLHFSSPIKYFEEMDNKHYLYAPKDIIAGAGHLRKALYMSGWDWGPTLPDMGIFRPVVLTHYNHDRISDIQIRQFHEDGRVRLHLALETAHACPEAQATVTVDGRCIALIDGKGEVVIDAPKLWWPRGYGEQPLYDLTFTLALPDGTVLDECTKTVGLRTLTVSTARDEEGSEFCFVVNGVKIFAKGANYIPVDNILPRITPARIQKVIDDCCFANFNCIRVWGGAYYPEDCFYDMCDRAGLIIWQDFMTACISVWMRPAFEREMIEESIDNIKRIRHHACIGLLCGNNEMEDAISSDVWGPPDNLKVKMDYLKLYEGILPELCEEYAPDIFYLCSSPTSGGGFDEPCAPNRGDVHFWEVWNHGMPFEEYRKYKFRFCSEYGFESMPSIKTVDAFCPPEERNLLSYTMENHQKHTNGNAKFLSYLASMYQMPSTLEGMVYATQMNQAMAIQFGVEHFRRIRPYCMGSIYWQLNDCWPVSSWSSIDYYGRYKALHYFARKFYAPIAMGLFADRGKMTINIANETREPVYGKIKCGIMKNDFTPISEQTFDLAVDALTSSDVRTLDFSEVVGTRDKYFYADLYDAKGNFITRRTELGTRPKHFLFLAPDIKVDATEVEDGVMLTLRASVLVKNLELSFAHEDPVLSDNFFDIATDTPIQILVKTSTPKDELLRTLRMRSVYDIPVR